MLENFTIESLIQGYKDKKFSVSEVVSDYYNRIAKVNPDYNVYVSLYRDLAEQRVANMSAYNTNDHMLYGVPLGLKDLFSYKGSELTAASKILKGFKYKIFEKKDLSNRITKIGELGVKSKTLLTSYYNNRHLFKKSFKEGFFLTGDYVSINKKNIFFYIDRKKDLIIKGGVNILPSEIENIIQNIREIKEVAITSIYDEFYGENVCCFLVFKKKSKLSLKKIDNYCLRHLGNFKKPNKYIVLKKLPKGPSGKILKLVLKKKYEKK
mgnify:CR=1 FL=1